MKNQKTIIRLLAILIINTLLFVSGSVVAGAAEDGKQKTAGCVSCHGMNGRSNNPNYPNLAGQKKNYLIKALKAYRDKKREDTMMNSLTASLSDADIDAIAAYYSSQKAK